MFNVKLCRWTGAVTLFFFILFLIPTDQVIAQEDDDLLKARRLYQQGDYESSIKVLSDFVNKLKAVVAQKKKVSEAFYLLAKIYFEVGDDEKVDDNLRKVFETYPTFSTQETNLGFRDRVEKIKNEVLAAPGEESSGEETVTEPDEPSEPSQPENVISQTGPEKKKKKFPMLLVLGGVVVVGVVLALVLKKSDKDEDRQYDIRGDWTNNWNVLGFTETHYFNFSGSLTSGTFVDEVGDTGTYAVSDRSVAYEYDEYTISATGTFTGYENMSGTLFTAVGNGTWNAQKDASAAAIAAQAKKEGKSALQSLKERCRK